MGLTLEECERLGIAHEHPEHPSRKGDEVPKRARVSKVNALGQNKTEAQFDAYLTHMKYDRRIIGFWFEPFKLRLAGRTYYSPDFVVRRNDWSLAIIEIKGFMRDDAACKIKVADEQFGWLAPFYLVRRDRACEHGWDVRAVGRGGIGTASIGPNWMVSQ